MEFCLTQQKIGFYTDIREGPLRSDLPPVNPSEPFVIQFHIKKCFQLQVDTRQNYII